MDEQIRMENLKKLSMGKGRGGKSTKSPNMKSPKAGKGKKSTTWDPVLYGGKVNKEEVSSEFLYLQSPFKYKHKYEQ